MNHNQWLDTGGRAPVSPRHTRREDTKGKLLGDLTAMRNAALMTEDEYRRMKRRLLATVYTDTPARTSIADTRCVLCDRVGFTHRERTITAQQSFVEYVCGACAGSWRAGAGQRASRFVARSSTTSPTYSRPAELDSCASCSNLRGEGFFRARRDRGEAAFVVKRR